MSLQTAFGNTRFNSDHQMAILDRVTDHCSTQTLGRICVVSKTWALVCQQKLTCDAKRRALLVRSFVEITSQADSYISKYKEFYFFSNSSNISPDKVRLRKELAGWGSGIGVVTSGVLNLTSWGHSHLPESVSWGAQCCLDILPNFLWNPFKAGGLGLLLGETGWEYHIWNSNEFKEWRIKQIGDEFLNLMEEYFHLDRYLEGFVCPLSNKLLEDPIETSIDCGSVNFYDRQAWQLRLGKQFNPDPSYRIQLIIAVHQKRLLDQCSNDLQSETDIMKDSIQFLHQEMSKKISSLKDLAVKQLDTILMHAPHHPLVTVYQTQIIRILSKERIPKGEIKPLRVIEEEIREEVKS